MAVPKPEPPAAILFAAIFSRHPQAIEWAAERAQQAWGKILLKSPVFAHEETQYYTADMGEGLQKQFVVFDNLYDPGALAKTKLESNAWEQQLAENNANYPEPRPVNIDPGYLTLSKLVLASAKDRAHRIYLSDGIYAEESLYYLDGRWHCRPWTYPDYQRSEFHDFFQGVREELKRLISLSITKGKVD